MSAPPATIASIVTAVRPRQARSLLRPGSRSIVLPGGRQVALTVAPPPAAPRLRVIRVARTPSLYDAYELGRQVPGDVEQNIKDISRYGALLENDVYGWRGNPGKFVVRRKPDSSVFTHVTFDRDGRHYEGVTDNEEQIRKNWAASFEIYNFWKSGGRVPIFVMRGAGDRRRIDYSGRDLPAYSSFEGEKPLPQDELIWINGGIGNEMANLQDPRNYFTYKMPTIHKLIEDPEGDISITNAVRRVGRDGEERNVRETRRFRRASEEEIEEGIRAILEFASYEIGERTPFRRLERIYREMMEWRKTPTMGNTSDFSEPIDMGIVEGETIFTIWWPRAGRSQAFNIAEWTHPWAKFALKEDKGSRAVRAGEHMCAFKAAVLTVGRKVQIRKNRELYQAFDQDGVCPLSRCWLMLRELLPKGETLSLIDCRGGNVPIDLGEKLLLKTLEGEYVEIENIKNVIALVDSPSGPHWLPISDDKLRAFLIRESEKTVKAVEKHTKTPAKTERVRLAFIDFETAKDSRDTSTEKHRHYVYGAAVICENKSRHFRPLPDYDVLNQLVEYLESLPFPFIAVAYNGRGFDSHFLVEAYTRLGYRVSNKVTIVAGSRYLKVGMERGNFRGSWDPNAFIPTSLDRAAKDFAVECGGKIPFSHDEIEQIADEASRETAPEADPNEIMIKIWEKIAARKGEKAVDEMVAYNLQDVKILQEISQKLIESLQKCSVDLAREYVDEALAIKAKVKGARKTKKMEAITPLDPVESPTISNFAFSCLTRALTLAKKAVGKRNADQFTLLSTAYLFDGQPERAAASTSVMNQVAGKEMDPLSAAFYYEQIIRKTLIGGRCEITNPLTLREEKFSIDRDAVPSTAEIPLGEPIVVADICGLYSYGARGLFATGELEVARGIEDVHSKAGVHLVDVENQPAKAIIPIRTEDGRWDWKAGANYPAHDVEMGGVHYHREEQVGAKIYSRWMLSVDIEELLSKGATVTWYKGFNYTSRHYILEPFVRICDKRKNEPGVSPALRATWKIFQNSTYGKFLQKNRSETKSKIYTDLFSMHQEIVESPFEQVLGETPQTLEVSEMTGGAWFVRVRAPWKPSNLPGIVGAQVYAHSRAHVYNNYFYPLASQMPVRSPMACDTDSAFVPLSYYEILMEREAAKGPNEPQFLARDEKDKKTGLSILETACDKAIFAARKAYWLSANRLHEPGYCAELAPYAFTPEQWEKTKTSELKPKTRLKGCRAASNPPPQWELKRGDHIIAHGKGIGEEFFSAAVQHDIREAESLNFSHWHIKSSRTAGVMLLRGWKKFRA